MTARRTRADRTRIRHAIVVFVLAALILLFATPRALLAQAKGGTVNATAEVLPPPVTGTGIQELRFGSARPGDAVDVPPGPAAPGAATSSAGWHFGNIRKGRWVSLALTLPPTLQRGAYAIPVDWDNADYGRICVARASGACALDGAFNPGASPSLNFYLSPTLPGNNFDVSLYTGARVTVPAVIPPGVYSATVVATFAYVT